MCAKFVKCARICVKHAHLHPLFSSLDALILAITELEQHDTIHTYLESPQCLLFNKTQDHAGITREHIQQIMEKGKHMGNMLLSVLQVSIVCVVDRDECHIGCHVHHIRAKLML